jgi:hypothetical protein
MLGALVSLSVRPPRAGGGACEASALFPVHCASAACSHLRRPVISTPKPTALGGNGGDEEGRRGWRRPGSRAVARLGSKPRRGHPSPCPTVSRRIAGPWPGDGAAVAGVGVGDRGGRVRGGFWSGAWSGSAGSEPPLMYSLDLKRSS